MQTNDYFYMQLITWNHIILYKLLAWDINPLNDVTVYKQMITSRSTLAVIGHTFSASH